MKNQIKQVMMAILAFAFCILLQAMPAQAATMEEVLSLDTDSTNTGSFRRDLTGDGVAEKVTVKLKGQYYYEQKVEISVNGKKLATLKPDNVVYHVDVQYISMSKHKKIIAIRARGNNGDESINAIYRYDGGKKKLIRVQDFNFKYGRSHSYESIKKVTSNTITIHYESQFYETGYITWDFVYTYKNGKFKLKSNTANVKSYHYPFKAARSLIFYTSTSLSKKAFTAKKGDVLKLQKIKVINKKVYLRFKKNGKTGWIKIGNSFESVYKNIYSNNGWFYDIQLAG